MKADHTTVKFDHCPYGQVVYARDPKLVQRERIFVLVIVVAVLVLVFHGWV